MKRRPERIPRGKEDVLRPTATLVKQSVMPWHEHFEDPDVKYQFMKS
jgi:hypothetical protein